MEGRLTGSAGEKLAADYLIAELKKMGARPLPGSTDFRMPFTFTAGSKDGGSKMSVAKAGSEGWSFAGSANIQALSFSDTGEVSGSIVFAGYGLVVPAIGYDDYARVDVAGKAVLIFSHEPQEQNASSRLNGSRPMPQTTLQAKAAAARSRGARALIVVSDPSHRRDEGQYALFKADPDAENHGIPVLRVRRAELQPLIAAWSLDAAARMIDNDLVPRSRELEGAAVDYVEHLALNRRTVRNVVAVLPGADPARARDAVVVGAHYDHVGYGGRLSVSPDRTGEIHNGADDNASGTAAIIEMARAAVGSRERFPRTLIFIAFAGEERGLLGSAHYVTQPTIPTANTVAMINLDMVGRARGSVDVSGLEGSRALEQELEAALASIGGGLNVKHEGPGAGRSDDSSFLSRNIPAVNFFTGFHDDYHRPGDDWEKIDVAGTRQVATLALEFAARLASRK